MRLRRRRGYSRKSRKRSNHAELLARCPTAVQGETINNEGPIVTFDFETFFPHRFWISDWKKDEAYPNGFRYKLLSVRNEAKDEFELVVILEQPEGFKTEMSRLVCKPEAAFDRTAHKFVEGLGSKFGIGFEEQDFSDIRTEEEFESRAASEGWHSSYPL